MTSPDDMIDDPNERERLEKYIDLNGIKDFDDFVDRVKKAFSTDGSGNSFWVSLSQEGLGNWYRSLEGQIQERRDQEPIKQEIDEFDFDDTPKYKLGYTKKGAVGIVKKQKVSIKGDLRVVHRDSKGRFASVKKETVIRSERSKTSKELPDL